MDGRRNRIRAAFIAGCVSLALPSGMDAGIPDAPFVQEEHLARPIAGAAAANDVRAVAVDSDGNVWSATKAGVFRLDRGRGEWRALLVAGDAGPAYAIAVDGEGGVWIGAWNGVYRWRSGRLVKLTGIDEPVAALCTAPNGIFAFGPEGARRIDREEKLREPVACARSVRAAVSDPQGTIWIATQRGLFRHAKTGSAWFHLQAELLSADVRDVEWSADGDLWVGCLGGVTVYRGGKRVTQFTSEEGLPSVEVSSIARAPDGTMWVGTTRGVARFDGSRWSWRHSRRWLLSDDVRDVAFGADGTAWIATGSGVSAIQRRRVTLAEKAAHYLEACLSRHVREPGIVEKCRLEVPGDVSTWKPRDDDNDGQYTAMYLAMESFRFAVTKDPRARDNARRAFEALRFLQTVTGTASFVARTVIPSHWTRMADPNREISDREWADQRVRDPRSKRVTRRWHRSSDGKWLWKGDTSSDEITGHMWGYLVYYDLAADEPQRHRVRDHVRRIVDGIIEADYVLKDVDGKHTRWGVWAPEYLNRDPEWRTERGVNSVEILSFLKCAHHMTGDRKYEKEYRRLLDEHGYAANVSEPRTTNPSWRTHIDDELLALSYPAILHCEEDPELRRLFRRSLDVWHATVREDRSPYFNFVYSSLAGRVVDPEESVAFLRDAPLDLIRWRVDNTRRADLRLVRAPEVERVQTDRLPPPSERGVMRWDDNPWDAVQGDGGHTESDGVFWLLPYWMGRHYGFIDPPK